jgi:hypothetical protein
LLLYGPIDMTADTPIERTAEWIEREYGREKWPAIERTIDAICNDETSPPNMARVIARVSRSEMYGGGGALAEFPAVVSGKELHVARGIAYGAYQQLIVDAVVDDCTTDTDAVVELGSGWARNLLRVWLGGGPANAIYVGGEFTASGRRAATRLAELEPSLRFISLPFDYRQPDFSPLDRFRHAVVFTAHSVEQVPRVSVHLLAAMRSIAARVTCLHFEPVGWQVDERVPTLTQERLGSSRAYAIRNDYNVNLIETLRLAEADEILKIEHITTEAVGINPSNAASVVRWSSLAHL